MTDKKLTTLQEFSVGLQIILAKTPETKMSSEHDEIFIGDTTKFSKSELVYMNSIGFHVDDEHECFYFLT